VELLSLTIILKLYRNERERRQEGQQLITAPEKNGEM
jgi:hypothetical protein